MYIEMVCHKNDVLKCIKCSKKIVIGETFYGDTAMEGAPFCNEICSECNKYIIHSNIGEDIDMRKM